VERGKFWAMHEHLFAHRDSLDPAHLSAYAALFGIPRAGDESESVEAGHCYDGRIEKKVQGGLRSPLSGTPTILVNGRCISGATTRQRCSRRSS
jgi:protein-disulfide isomerase